MGTPCWHPILMSPPAQPTLQTTLLFSWKIIFPHFCSTRSFLHMGSWILSTTPISLSPTKSDQSHPLFHPKIRKCKLVINQGKTNDLFPGFKMVQLEFPRFINLPLVSITFGVDCKMPFSLHAGKGKFCI